MNSSKSTLIANAIAGRLLSLIGWFFGFFSVIAISIAARDMQTVGSSEGAAIGLIILMAIFAFSTYAALTGSQLIKRNKRFKKYIALISNFRITSIPEIAKRTKQTAAFVRKDMQMMIDKKFFTNARIDHEKDEIIIEGLLFPNDSKTENEPVKCPGCGAVNIKQKGGSGNCEYCGSAL